MGCAAALQPALEHRGLWDFLGVVDEGVLAPVAGVAVPDLVGVELASGWVPGTAAAVVVLVISVEDLD